MSESRCTNCNQRVVPPELIGDILALLFEAQCQMPDTGRPPMPVPRGGRPRLQPAK